MTPSADSSPEADLLHHELLGLLPPAAAGDGSWRRVGLERLCRSLTTRLDLFGATINLMVDHGPQGLAAVSGAEVRAVDAVQFDIGEGPSREAFITGRTVLVDDLHASASAHRWPGLVADARVRDLCAVYAFPLQQGAARLGVLTGYAGRARSLTSTEFSVCGVHVEVATEVLLTPEPAETGADEPTTFLRDHVQIRTEVYMAQGMTMVDLDVSLTEAMVRMRAAAFAAGTTLNDLAVEIVAGRLRLDPDAGPVPRRDPHGS